MLRQEGDTTSINVTPITSQVMSINKRETRRRNKTIESSSHPRGKRPNGLVVRFLAVSLKVMSSVPLSDTPFEEGISKERERRRCEVDDDDDDDGVREERRRTTRRRRRRRRRS